KPGSTEIIRLADVATISRGPVELPQQIIRFNGERAFTVGVSVTDGLNVVEVGELVDQQIQTLKRSLPLGVEVYPIHLQHQVVSDAISTFFRNLTLSVATVVGALCLFMGWRAGTVVGSVLLLTVLGTIALMALLGINLQRISLGALMIAMGMLVDNAIVVAEGMVIGVRRGLDPADAAAQSVKRTQFALLGATVIGILAFAPIGLSNDNSGYFLRSLFQVVAISLLLSWVLAVTVVPLLGNYLLVASKTNQSTDSQTLYAGWGYAAYRTLITFGLRRHWLAVIAISAITLSCFWGAQFVKQGFFPSTNTPVFFIDYYLPQGTDIHTTADEIKKLEEVISRQAGVSDVTSFIGRGSSRFSTTVRPEQPNPAYANIVVRVDSITEMDTIIARVADILGDLMLDAELQFNRSE
ncbi:MAG: efflux RND transporter permease subunit, partial [Pseudomonadales bacterium]